MQILITYAGSSPEFFSTNFARRQKVQFTYLLQNRLLKSWVLKSFLSFVIEIGIIDKMKQQFLVIGDHNNVPICPFLLKPLY